jgi:hypothetical protein
LLNVKNIINLIAMVTPYLMMIIFVILIYSIFTMDLSIAEASYGRICIYQGQKC